MDREPKMSADRQADRLHECFLFRYIRDGEAGEAAEIERICFPPNEACTRKRMEERAAAAPDLFLVAIDRRTGKMAGFLNGIATDEEALRDEFFTDAGNHCPYGKNVMLLSLTVLPEYRRQGLGRELVRVYAGREKTRGRAQLVLTCLDEKVEMYRKFGFRDQGESASVWGGEKWHEMSLPLQAANVRDAESGRRAASACPVPKDKEEKDGQNQSYSGDGEAL